MKNIQDAQSNLVNDSCNDCGSYADIGAVIDEHDRLLVINLFGDQADEKSKTLSNLACARFEDVKCHVQRTGSGIDLTIEFAFSAEKMIFQLENTI